MKKKLYRLYVKAPNTPWQDTGAVYRCKTCDFPLLRRVTAQAINEKSDKVTFRLTQVDGGTESDRLFDFRPGVQM